MKIDDVAEADQLVRALKGLDAVRKDTQLGREPRYSEYTVGLEVGYYEGDSGGGEGGANVHLPLTCAAEILDAVEKICSKRLTALGAS